jgi:hypothetical protein
VASEAIMAIFKKLKNTYKKQYTIAISGIMVLRG